MSNRILSIGILLGFLCLGVAGRVEAAAGDLDPTFGVGGKVTTDFFGDFDLLRCVLVQPDGKIVAGGSAINTGLSTDYFALARYNPDGSLDSSFGIGGKVTTSNGPYDNVINSIALQPDGKIVAAGISNSGGTPAHLVWTLARFTASGGLDPTFGVGGIVMTSFPGGLDGSGEAEAILVQPDGRIVAGGIAGGNAGDFALARYDSDGTLDASFGIGGEVLTDFSGMLDIATSLALQPDGKIVAAGNADVLDPLQYKFGVARYNDDGSLDSGFGAGGKVVTVIQGADEISAVALQADGKIVVAGTSGPTPFPPDNSVAIARYLSNGSLDSSFGTGGIVITSLPGGHIGATDVALLSCGKIGIAGWGPGTGIGSDSFDFLLARYNPDGTSDSSFGVGGKVLTDFAGSSDTGSAMALQSDGKVIVAGDTSASGGGDFALARYLDPDPSCNQPPDCSAAVPSLSLLWPPDHSLRSISILGVTDPDGDPVTITITGITQDEPTHGLGSGDVSPDGFGVATSQAEIRAERSGSGNGRVYVISFVADDGRGETCTGSVSVGVPHDQGKGSVPVDDGQLYDSTLP